MRSQQSTRLWAALGLAVTAAACSTTSDPIHPNDPDTPLCDQARSEIVAELAFDDGGPVPPIEAAGSDQSWLAVELEAVEPDEDCFPNGIRFAAEPCDQGCARREVRFTDLPTSLAIISAPRSSVSMTMMLDTESPSVGNFL